MFLTYTLLVSFPTQFCNCVSLQYMICYEEVFKISPENIVYVKSVKMNAKIIP
jgi:hypothetical protein